MKKTIIPTIIAFIVLLLLIPILRGWPNAQPKDTREGSFFEGSNTNSRFSLVESLAENNSVFFTKRQADFGRPDVTFYKGNYFTTFTPGLSFVSLPFYLIGKNTAFSDISTYSTNIIFTIINFFLIYSISKKFNSDKIPSLISASLFVFASNALAYSNTLTQHHGSTSVILGSILIALNKPSIFSNLFIGALLGIGLLFDIPNAFALAPILIYWLVKHINIRPKRNLLNILNPSIFAIIIGLLPLLSIFGWYNFQTAGSVFKLAQMIGRTAESELEKPNDDGNTPTFAQQSDLEGKKLQSPKPIFTTPYNTRLQINGIYTLLISDERGWFYYNLYLVLGIIGLFVISRKNEHISQASLCLTVIFTIICFYIMFPDPWGGWSFGPRYLIPATAILSIFVSVAITRYRTNLFVISMFVVTTIYSVNISTLGALTTNLIPPKVEAIYFSDPQPYNPQKNIEYLKTKGSSSMLFNSWLEKHITAQSFHLLYSLTIIAMIIIMFTYYSLKKNENK